MTPEKQIDHAFGNGWRGLAAHVLYEKGLGTLISIVLVSAGLYFAHEFTEMHRQHLVCTQDDMEDMAHAIIKMADTTERINKGIEESQVMLADVPFQRAEAITLLKEAAVKRETELVHLQNIDATSKETLTHMKEFTGGVDSDHALGAEAHALDAEERQQILNKLNDT